MLEVQRKILKTGSPQDRERISLGDSEQGPTPTLDIGGKSSTRRHCSKAS